MDLILWRHADAEILRAGQSDLDRALTPKGERQARRMAAWLDARLDASTRIVVSPALRARQTAEALGRKFETAKAIAPDRSADELLAAVRWPDGDVPVLVVGHQPTLGIAAARLLAGVAQDWAIRKCAVWWLRAGGARAQVTLLAAQTVEMLK